MVCILHFIVCLCDASLFTFSLFIHFISSWLPNIVEVFVVGALYSPLLSSETHFLCLCSSALYAAPKWSLAPSSLPRWRFPGSIRGSERLILINMSLHWSYACCIWHVLCICMRQKGLWQSISILRAGNRFTSLKFELTTKVVPLYALHHITAITGTKSCCWLL